MRRLAPSLALFVLPLACQEPPDRDEVEAAVDESAGDSDEASASVESATSNLVWEPEIDVGQGRRARRSSAQGEGQYLESRWGHRGEGAPDATASPLLSNVIFEMQGALNGPALGYLGNQYYLSSTIEWVGVQGLEAHETSWFSLLAERERTNAARGSAASTWKRATAPVHATKLEVGRDDELPLQGVEAQVWVDGFRARVLLDCTYENDRDRELEGTFKLRLPEGATPYYLAFGESVVDLGAEAPDRSRAQGPEPETILPDREEVWRGAREARFVPRKQAARAYKSTVRRRVDPALMEWAGAGVFQARVFPLQPHTRHRVVVGYETDLVALPGAAHAYELVLSMPEDLPALSLELHVLAPDAASVSVEPEAVPFLAGRRRTWSYPSTDARQFRVRVPDLGGTALVSHEEGGFFAMDLAPEMEAVHTDGSPAAVFAVDTSLSSSGGRFAIWLALMEAILERNEASIHEFAVEFFDVSPRWWRPEPVPNTEAARRALRAYAESLALEGASDLGAALREAARPAWSNGGWSANRDLFLLSDGAATWGEGDARAILDRMQGAAEGSIFAYTTGLAGTDRRNLEVLTRDSGGALFSVTGEGAIESAAVAHTFRPWRIDSVRVSGGTDLLLRGRPTVLYPGQRLRLVGRGTPAPGDRVELELVGGGRRTTRVLEVEHALETPLAARAYGVEATERLEELGAPLADAARAYATRFRVPGRTCSLLMLESDEDYEEQGVLPSAEALRASDRWPASDVAEAVETAERERRDPVQSLLHVVEPLADAEILEALDPELIAGLRGLPASRLAVDPEPLEVESLLAEAVPEEVRVALESGEPDYALVREESARRLAELGTGDAVRAISCLVELNPGDTTFARDVAQTLASWGLAGHAYQLHLRVAEARPFEPDSYLSLGRCAMRAGRGDLALFWLTVALRGSWRGRFGATSRVAAFELANLRRELERGELRSELADRLGPADEELTEIVGLDEADVAVVIQWNTDASDIDLHVREPGGEVCFFGHRSTQSGGQLSPDVTQGFGPELYVMPDAPDGIYEMWVHYYGSSANRTNVATRVFATVYQEWGTPDQVRASRLIDLDTVESSKGIARLTMSERELATASVGDRGSR